MTRTGDHGMKPLAWGGSARREGLGNKNAKKPPELQERREEIVHKRQGVQIREC